MILKQLSKIGQSTRWHFNTQACRCPDITQIFKPNMYQAHKLRMCSSRFWASAAVILNLTHHRIQNLSSQRAWVFESSGCLSHDWMPVRCNWAECCYYRPQYGQSISKYNHSLVSCQIRQIADCACVGNARIVSLPPRVCDPDMYHGARVTHVPWYMSGSVTSSFLFEVGGGGNVPGIPIVCATRKFTFLVKGPYRWTYRCEVCSSYRSLLGIQYVDGMVNFVKVLKRLLICWLLL